MTDRPSRGAALAASAVTAAALCLLPAGAAVAASPVAPLAAVTVAPATTDPAPSAVLAATAWETTAARDQDGNAVALTDPAVSNFVGWAYYDTAGTFRLYNPDDSPKMQGDWSVEETADGLTRTLVAKDADGAVLFTRVVPIVVLTGAEFTYRIFPEAGNTAVYYDIVHTPTDHAEPGVPSPAAVLAATPWETTAARDQDGNAVALTDPAVSNFVGWAYYDEAGTFRLYNPDDSPKMQGDWSVERTAGGLTRTLVAKDAAGAVLFTRIVPIVVLTEEEFTYRIFPEAGNTAVYYDIIHTPTDHPEPTSGGGGDEGGDNGGGTGGGDNGGGGTGGGDPQPETDPVVPAPTPSTDQPVLDGTTPTRELAQTGSASPITGTLVAGALALLSGAALLARRFLRPTRG